MRKVIAIGALGGSGTRAVAKIFSQASIYLGDDLNAYLDNLIFTRLFKDPSWKSTATDSDINLRLGAFEEYMQTGYLSKVNARVLIQAARSNSFYNTRWNFYWHIFQKRLTKPSERKIWAWKEPNAQIYITELLDYFPKLKYIHVLRHGLDMAYSDNNQQLKNWGHLFNINLNGQESKVVLAQLQLKYWIESTRIAIQKMNSSKERCLIVNHSDLCNEPQKQVDKILDFAEMDISASNRSKLYDIPQKPQSTNRFKKQDLSIFSSNQLEFVKEMGFTI